MPSLNQIFLPKARTAFNFTSYVDYPSLTGGRSTIDKKSLPSTSWTELSKGHSLVDKAKLQKEEGASTGGNRACKSMIPDIDDQDAFPSLGSTKSRK
ncbi:MAG: hypothetical protein AB7F64_09890 [Gammaproteobacteria bacterium]